jgi:hypothetical protein
VLLLLCSCNYFEDKKIHATDGLVEEKLQELDKTTVDKYPIFENCETEHSTNETEKMCFVATLSQHIFESLSEQDLILDSEFEENIHARIEVTNLGHVNIVSLELTPLLTEKIPNIEALITQSITDLPEIKPAYKKIHSGELIAVTTQFIIPVRVVGEFENVEIL